MMKLGEAAGRLSRGNVPAPPGVAWTDAIDRNWLIHQYDEVDRALTWETISRDLASWRSALPLVHGSRTLVELVVGIEAAPGASALRWSSRSERPAQCRPRPVRPLRILRLQSLLLGGWFALELG